MKRKILIICVILTTIFIGFAIIIPIVPEVITDVGAQPFHLGMLLTLYSAMSFFFSPFWGSVSDKIGRRPVLMIGLVGFSLSFLVFGFALDHLWLMYVSRILGGLFSGAATACAIAYISDITTREERTKGMGLAGMSIGMGFIFGPAIGGLLSVWDLRVPFFASAILALLTCIFAWAFLEESLDANDRTSTDEPNASRWSAFQGPLKYLYILSFIVTFTLAFLETTLQLFQKVQIGITPFEIGWLFAINGIVGAAVQGGYVRRKVQPGQEIRTVSAGLLLSAAGFALILFSANFWTATLYVCVFGVGNALIRPCITSLITQKTTLKQGVASGLISSMDSLGRMIGPVSGSLLFQIDIELPYIFASVFCLGSILLVYGFVVSDRKAKVAEA